MSSELDILILTAGFGDGHNSAARNLESALSQQCQTRCLDPCALGAPFLNERLRSFYRGVTTHAPWLWRRIYLSTEKQDFSRERLPMMRKPEQKLHELLLELKPRAIVSTYPLYPYFLERSFKRGVPRVPVFTVVTDSIEINAAWRKAPTDYWLVTDENTRQSLIQQGLGETSVIETGFPVHPHFSDLSPITADDPLEPFRVIYFPTAKKPHVRRIAREILNATSENVHLTVVLGRNMRKLYKRTKEIKLDYPGRVKIKGWTKRVPELLTNHHLVVGKAGGATVHESLAAACPMLIHHLVPGQEEGNLTLLRKLNGGYLADSPGALDSHIREMLADKAAGWRAMKRSLTRVARPGAAHTAANFILSQLEAGKS
ncbi:MAG: hypothetical protein AB8F34_15845 [Akkermansiaceae bacterium]